MKLVPFVDAEGTTVWVNPDHVQLVQPALEEGFAVITFSYEDDIAVVGSAGSVAERLVNAGSFTYQPLPPTKEGEQ